MHFSDKDPDEVEFVGFNFSPRLATGETLVSATFYVVVVAGVDATPDALLQGEAIVDGGVAKHKVGGGVSGVHYRVCAHAVTSSGQTLVESASLVVKDAG